MATRKELVEALRVRYREAATPDKVKILDEFGALTGYHRKHAIRLLREEVSSNEAPKRDRLYDEATREALTVLWEAADRVCGKRLRALIPMLVDAMERHGHLDLDPVVRAKVLRTTSFPFSATGGEFHGFRIPHPGIIFEIPGEAGTLYYFKDGRYRHVHFRW